MIRFRSDLLAETLAVALAAVIFDADIPVDPGVPFRASCYLPFPTFAPATAGSALGSAFG